MIIRSKKQTEFHKIILNVIRVGTKIIPEWQYPLYKGSDRQAYLFIKKLANTKHFPRLYGSQKEISLLLKFLILSQKLKDYRKFRDIVLPEFKGKEVNVPKLLKATEDIKIPRGIDESWAIFTQDKRLCELMDEFNDAQIGFVGTNDECVEFVMRFLLSQLLQDWRGPKMAVLLECLKTKKVKVKKLNVLLGIWDYTKVFSSRRRACSAISCLKQCQ